MCTNLSLLDRYGNVHSMAGLNWGYSNGHVCENDAYIPIKANVIRSNLTLFNPITENNIIYVTWDDGTEMTCLLEGSQIINSVTYPKQISSYNDKSILGVYLRERLGVFHSPIVLEDLISYGRTDISVTKTSNTHYFFNFSAN
ncbi:restriction endonuclease PLD domain-containing protein [Clostridium paraputrificum]|uniref:restriction endonuclease PLD domain-containing protein n=1 Tax=Clostridium paraputrificum TaxID=29363 RepID=UPI0006C18885|nr:restriction endonuclease PLD domain-containing protein [Clostridium paraputrificum]CUO39944.1 NgoFVII restriction endonuclease [Clostridium paraputrificum]